LRLTETEVNFDKNVAKRLPEPKTVEKTNFAHGILKVAAKHARRIQYEEFSFNLYLV
jgi:hypothetical protein